MLVAEGRKRRVTEPWNGRENACVPAGQRDQFLALFKAPRSEERQNLAMHTNDENNNERSRRESSSSTWNHVRKEGHHRAKAVLYLDQEAGEDRMQRVQWKRSSEALKRISEDMQRRSI